MKARLILGIALLATLLVSTAYLLAPPRLEAQQAADVQRAHKILNRAHEISDMRARLVHERRIFEEQAVNEIHQLAAREEQLKIELAQLAQKRAALEQSLERRRQELQGRIDAATAEIRALGAVEGPAMPRIDSLEDKLDRILNRLDAIEKRLDNLEKSAKKPLFSAPPK